MQIPTPNAPEKREHPPLRLMKRIGSTTYKVAVYFSRTSKETMGDKILRLIENEAAGAHRTPIPIPKSNGENQVPQTPPTAGKSVS